MEERYIGFIQDVLITVHENILELSNRKAFADPEEFAHIDTKLLAYREFLSILSQSADEFRLPKEKIGI